MSMLSHRLQVLIDDDRFERLQTEAAQQRVPVAVLVREAIDAAYPATDAARRAAGTAVLDAEPMAVSDEVGALLGELEELRGRRG